MNNFTVSVIVIVETLVKFFFRSLNIIYFISLDRRTIFNIISYVMAYSFNLITLRTRKRVIRITLSLKPIPEYRISSPNPSTTIIIGNYRCIKMLY